MSTKALMGISFSHKAPLLIILVSSLLAMDNAASYGRLIYQISPSLIILAKL